MVMKTIELNVISAKDLKNVSLFGKMSVYVVVSLSGDPDNKRQTRARHDDGGSNPCWNHHKLRFEFDEDTAANCRWDVVLLLRRELAIGPDKDYGEVRLPLTDLISDYRPAKPNVARHVRKDIGNPSPRPMPMGCWRSNSSSWQRAPNGGVLEISYTIEDNASAAAPQATFNYYNNDNIQQRRKEPEAEKTQPVRKKTSKTRTRDQQQQQEEEDGGQEPARNPLYEWGVAQVRSIWTYVLPTSGPTSKSRGWTRSNVSASAASTTFGDPRRNK